MNHLLWMGSTGPSTGIPTARKNANTKPARQSFTSPKMLRSRDEKGGYRGFLKCRPFTSFGWKNKTIQTPKAINSSSPTISYRFSTKRLQSTSGTSSSRLPRLLCRSLARRRVRLEANVQPSKVAAVQVSCAAWVDGNPRGQLWPPVKSPHGQSNP